MVHVACDKCGRAGQYRKATLITRYGAEIALPDLRHEIAKCDRRASMGDACGVHFVGLIGICHTLFARSCYAISQGLAVCLTPNKKGEHAYFPALITCLAFADFLSGLYAGKLERQSQQDLIDYGAKFMDAVEAPDYDVLVAADEAISRWPKRWRSGLLKIAWRWQNIILRATSAVIVQC